MVHIQSDTRADGLVIHMGHFVTWLIATFIVFLGLDQLAAGYRYDKLIIVGESLRGIQVEILLRGLRIFTCTCTVATAFSPLAFSAV